MRVTSAGVIGSVETFIETVNATSIVLDQNIGDTNGGTGVEFTFEEFLSGLVIIKGDLQVDGTQTIINSTTVTVNDLNITLADGAANAAAASGAGITVAGANASLIYYSGTDERWEFCLLYTSDAADE